MPTPTHDSPYDDVLAAAVRAARQGAAVIQEHAGERHTVRAKQTNDFVTAADEAAQSAILAALNDEGPGYDVLAEEGTDEENFTASVEGYRWIVDPIDGTTNFMHQIPPYAVSIALQHQASIVAAVVLDVPHDELFTAVAGHGLQVDGHPAQKGSADVLADAMIATGFPYRRFEHTEVYLEVLESVIRSTQGVRRHGSAAIDLARLACGRFDGFFETGLRPWDVAAGTLLVREGGGRVTDYRGQGGLAPVFGQQVCATNRTIHDALRARLQPMRDVRL